MFASLIKDKGKAYMMLSLLILIIISAVAGFCVSATVVHAADQTVTKREKYGLVIKDYPDMPGQEGISKTGYNFDGWYSSPAGGVKIDERTYTTPNKENTDLYAHWKPKQYKLTVNYSNSRNKSQTANNGSDVNAVNNITVTATQQGTGDTRTYTLANGGTCYLKFDDVVTVKANLTGSYTQGDWFYSSSTSRYKARHNISFDGWKITPVSTSPSKPVLANASADTTTFKWLCTDEIVLSCSGSDNTSRDNIQNYVERTEVRLVDDHKNITKEETLSVGQSTKKEANGNWVYTGFSVERSGNQIHTHDYYAYRGDGHPYQGYKVYDKSTGELLASITGDGGSRDLYFDAYCWR